MPRFIFKKPAHLLGTLSYNKSSKQWDTEAAAEAGLRILYKRQHLSLSLRKGWALFSLCEESSESDELCVWEKTSGERKSYI